MPTDFFDSSIFYLIADDWANVLPFGFLFLGIALATLAASFRAGDMLLRLIVGASLISAAAGFFSTILTQGRFFLGSSMELGPLERIVAGSVCVLGAITTIYIKSPSYKKHSEWGALLLLCVLGMALLPTARNWVAFFVYLETLSIPAYLLSALNSDKEKSLEASLKYLLMGAFVSGFFLLGITLNFGLTGTFQFDSILSILSSLSSGEQLLSFAAGSLIICSLGFKVSLFPFHMWAADVYQGAPAPVAAFLAGATKLSVFSALLFAFTESGYWELPGMSVFVQILGIASIVFGALMALTQVRFRRMLAYSGVVNAGFVALILPAGSLVSQHVIGFLVVYALALSACFAVHQSFLSTLGRKDDEDLEIDSLVEVKGRVSKFLPFLLGFALLSLAGIPPLPGFFTKYVLLSVLPEMNSYWSLGFALFGTLMGLSFYLRTLVPLSFYPAIEHKGNVHSKQNIAPCITALTATVLSVVLIVGFSYFQNILVSAELLAR